MNEPRRRAPPWFRFWAADWLADIEVASMTLAQRGAYITLLAYQWREGSIPADRGKLRRILGVRGGGDQPYLSILKSRFTKQGDPPKYVNLRLEQERLKQADWSQKQAEKGRKSAASRLNRGSTVVEPKGNLTDTESDTDDSADTTKPPPETTTPMSDSNGRSQEAGRNGEFSEARISEAARRVKGAISCAQSIPRIEDEVLAACLRSDHKPEDVASRADEKYKSYRGHDVWDFCRAEFPPKGNRGQDWVDGVIRRTKEQWRRMQDKKG